MYRHRKRGLGNIETRLYMVLFLVAALNKDSGNTFVANVRSGCFGRARGGLLFFSIFPTIHTLLIYLSHRTADRSIYAPDSLRYRRVRGKIKR